MNIELVNRFTYKLQNMILRKTIHDVRCAKKYSVALAKPLSELFNQPKPKFKYFVKNQTVRLVH